MQAVTTSKAPLTDRTLVLPSVLKLFNYSCPAKVEVIYRTIEYHPIKHFVSISSVK